jgi:hypothetical protein
MPLGHAARMKNVSHFDLMPFQGIRYVLLKEIWPYSMSQQFEYFIRIPPELKSL